jgi:hypothetical protein
MRWLIGSSVPIKSSIITPTMQLGLVPPCCFDTQTNSYTLSFRSSEYAADVNGGDRSRDILGADAEVKNPALRLPNLSA